MRVFATVEFVDETKGIFVSWKRDGGCKSGCGLCVASQSCKPPMTGPFINPDNIEVKKGDMVEADFYGSSHIVPAFVVFFLPIIIFFVSYVLHTHTIFGVFLTALFIMVVGYVIFLVKINKFWKNRVKGEIISLK